MSPSESPATVSSQFKSETIRQKHRLDTTDKKKSEIIENVNQAMNFSHDVCNLEKMMASKDDAIVQRMLT